MKSVLAFNVRYFVLAILLFAIEIIIALYFHDKFIRPYLGDFLVVILVYCFVKAFFNFPVLPTAIGVLLFSFAVETAQYFNVVQLLGLQHSKLARVVMGSSFEWEDLVTYVAGILLVIIMERRFGKR